MKYRAAISIVVGNVVGTVLVALTGLATVRYLPWGRWASDSFNHSAPQMAVRYADPVSLLREGALFNEWALGPIFALCIGAMGGLIYPRADWRLSILMVLSLVIFLAPPTSALKLLACCAYVALAWGASKVTLRLKPRRAPRPSVSTI